MGQIANRMFVEMIFKIKDKLKEKKEMDDKGKKEKNAKKNS